MKGVWGGCRMGGRSFWPDDLFSFCFGSFAIAFGICLSSFDYKLACE